MKMSAKQKNVLAYRYRNVERYCGQDTVDALYAIIHDEFDPYDCSAIISCLFDLEKDEREGVTEEYKQKVAMELKELVGKYYKPQLVLKNNLY